MNNVVLTSASQISPNSGNVLSSQPVVFESAVETLVAGNPLDPVEQTTVDGNFQAHMDVNYQAHDVALAGAKANGHEQTNGFKLNQHHAMEIDDGYEHPDKANSCCSMLNKFFLGAAIVCFALLLCSIAFIVANVNGLSGKGETRTLTGTPYAYEVDDAIPPSEKLLTDPYFNLTHPHKDGIIVVLSRRGASVNNILIPYMDDNNHRQYRSIVVRGNDQHPFGTVRFGFDDVINSYNMTNQLSFNYPYMDGYSKDWEMYGDINKPYRVRFVNDLIEVIYEFSSARNNELMMRTIVSAPVNQEIVADPTNNIYFNLRGYGNLNTHNLKLGPSVPFNISNSQEMPQNQLMQGEFVNQLKDVTNFFYKFNQAGIGKNYIATLTESETKTTMNIFADHLGAIIDPYGVSLVNPDMYGIRISPKQSPVYQKRSIYGPTLVVYPSQAIHTTWWQFEYPLFLTSNM